MNPELFMAFVLVAAALACTPGVDWAYSIAAGLRQRSFVPAVAGLCGGSVLTGAPGVLGWITLAGAAYLMWLGVSTLRSWRAASFTADGGSGGGTGLRTFLQGMGTSGINPKGLLFYVALVPQFVSADASLPVPVQSGLLGMTFVLLAGLVYTAVALLSRTLLQTRPGAARTVTLASGIIMVVLALVLLAEQLLPVLMANTGAAG